MAVRIVVAGRSEAAVYWITGEGDRLVVDGSDAFALESATVGGAPRAITTAASFEATARLSAGGGFSFTMPANSPEAAYLDVLQRLDCYWDHLLVVSGYVKEIAVEGETLTVTGDDMAHELAAVVVSAEATGLMDAVDAIDWIGDNLPDGWTLDNDVVGTQQVYVTEVVRESLLATLGAICTAAGLWFVIDGLTLRVADSYGAVVHGVQIGRLAKRADSNEIVNKVYPYGAGAKDVAVGLRASTLTPGGYAIDKDENSVTHSASAYPTREREVQFAKVAPTEATEAALIAAANALVLESVRYLQRHATPVVSYSAEVMFGRRLLPLERVALAVRTPALRVNGTPVVVESRIQIGAGSAARQSLTLEADARRIPTDAQVIAQAIVTASNSVLYPAPKAVNGTPSVGAHLTAGNVEYALPWSVGERCIQILSATLTGSVEDTGAVELEIGAIQYRLNGAGSWVALTGVIDLLSVLADADTGFPLATSGVVNVRVLGQAEHIPFVGERRTVDFTHPASGTQVLMLEAANLYTSLTFATVAGSFSAGDVFTTTGAANGGGLTWALQYFDGTNTYYMKYYTVDANNVVVWALRATTGLVDADMAAQLAIQGVEI